MVQHFDIQSSVWYGICAGGIVFGIILIIWNYVESPEFKQRQLRMKAEEEVQKQQEKEAFEQSKRQERQRIEEHERRVEEEYQKLLKKEGL